MISHDLQNEHSGDCKDKEKVFKLGFLPVEGVVDLNKILRSGCFVGGHCHRIWRACKESIATYRSKVETSPMDGYRWRCR